MPIENFDNIYSKSRKIGGMDEKNKHNKNWKNNADD